MAVSKIARPQHRRTAGAAARRAARRGGRADGVARPAGRADGEPPPPAKPRRDGRGRPPVTRRARPSPPRRPIGLAPGAPEEAAGQDAKKYATTNPVVQRLLARWMGRLHRRDRHGRRAPWSTSASARVSPSSGCSRPASRRSASSTGSTRSTPPGERLPAPVRACGPTPACCRSPTTAPTSSPASSCSSTCRPYEPAVDELARITRGRCVVSVPWEPWFRLGNLGRGKNVRRLGQRPRARPVLHPRAAAAALGRRLRRRHGHAGLPLADRRGPHAR